MLVQCLTLALPRRASPQYARQPLERLTLRRLLLHGRDAWFDKRRVVSSARFVQEELPKRLARRLLDLQLLPYLVVSNPHISAVYDAYYSSLQSLRSFPRVESVGDNAGFCVLLKRLVDEHTPMLDCLATGLREVRRKPLVGGALELDAFLEGMLRSRISRRVLAEQHLQLETARPGYVGIIATDLGLADSVELAAARCRQVCAETYGVAPPIVVIGARDQTIPYIPAHLDYMLYELFKNSARAVVEHHALAPRRGDAASHHTAHLPPIHVRICDGAGEVTLRISDQGGGMPVGVEHKAWQFGFSTIDGGR